MQSPLSNLSEVLEVARQSAFSYNDQLKVNETATRAVLIDPILRALGWDIANPTRVEVEKRIVWGKNVVVVDYALLNDGPKVIVEAKRLGDNLDDALSQIVANVFAAGVNQLFLTDGLRWRHYDNFSPGQVAPSRIIDLATEDLALAAAYLVQHLDAALLSPLPKPEDELSDKLQQLERRVASLEGKAPSQDNSPAVPVVKSKDDTKWTEIDPTLNFIRTKPILMRLPDGSVKEVTAWSQVLVATAQFALNCYPELLNQVPMKDKAQASVYLLQKDEYPSNLNSAPLFVEGEQVYLRIHYSANDCAANAGFILSKVPKKFRIQALSVKLAKFGKQSSNG